MFRSKKVPLIATGIAAAKLLFSTMNADAQWCSGGYPPLRQPIYTQAWPAHVHPVYPYHPYGRSTTVFFSYRRTRPVRYVSTEPAAPVPELKEEDALKMIEDYLNDHGLAWEENVNVGTTVVDMVVNNFPSPGQNTGIEYGWDELKKKLVERSTLYRCVLVGAAASGEEMLDGVDRELAEILDSSPSPKSNVKTSSKKKHH